MNLHNLALSAALLLEDFSSYPRGVCLPDGAAVGPWSAAYSGHGCTEIKTDGVRHWLEQAPETSRKASETHASLVLGPSLTVPLTFSADMATAAQLRRKDPPNEWETAWLVWNYVDDDHFYYFAPKPGGWELGKRDPSYAGGQRFLATGESPAFPLGEWAGIKIVQTANLITVYADGVLLVAFTDEERPYLSGKVGLYNEDARARFTKVHAASGAKPASTDGAKAPQKFVSPARQDTAEFGAAAAAVRIVDAKGRVVYTASRRGAAPIVWDGRDASGRARESGLYIARIEKDDGSAVYQSFVLVD